MLVDFVLVGCLLLWVLGVFWLFFFLGGGGGVALLASCLSVTFSCLLVLKVVCSVLAWVHLFCMAWFALTQ